MRLQMKVFLALAACASLGIAQNSAQSPSQTAGQSQAQTTTQGDTQSRTWKGMLVDASCTPSSAGTTSTNSDKDSSAAKDNDHSANRESDSSTKSTTDQWRSCQPTLATTSFGIVENGRLLKFDAKGNSLATAEMKSNSRWSGGNKSIEAKVKGTLSDDTIHVEAIEK